MKKELFSVAVLVIGGCLLSAIPGFSSGEHKHDHGSDHDHSSHETAGDRGGRVNLPKEMRRDLALDVGLVELRSVGGSKDPVIAVPAGAVLKDAGGKSFVFTKEETSGESGVYLKTEVEIGAGDSDYIEIRSGLFPGDTVVVENAERIPANENVADDAKGDGEKLRGGFVDRKKEVEPAAVVTKAAPKRNESPSPKCAICGEASISNGICRNGYCEVPIELNRFVCPPAAPRAHVHRNYGGGIYGEPSFGPGFGSSCPPAPCRW